MTNYREVKRKANVGERIKIVNAGYAGMPPVYRNGDVLTVINPVIPTTTGVRIDRKWNDGVVDAWVAHSEYVVLEPIAQSTIDGRKATVTDAGYRYSTYDTFAKHYGYPDAVDGYSPKGGEVVTLLAGGPHLSLHDEGTLWIAENSAGKRFIIGEKGLRIHAESTSQSTAIPTPDMRTLFADFLRQNPQASAELRKLLDEVDPQLDTPLSVPLDFGYDDAKPSETIPAAKPLTRAEVIAQARADVAELLRIGRSDGDMLRGSKHFHGRWYDVDFVVNRENRTVVALVYEINGLNRTFARYRGKPDAKGIARCAPDDVFHADIGRAIALRRALGLAVPGEYISAPKPEKAEVGAKVYTASSFGVMTVASKTNTRRKEISATCYATLGHCARNGDPAILDDTDVDYAKEAE